MISRTITVIVAIVIATVITTGNAAITITIYQVCRSCFAYVQFTYRHIGFGKAKVNCKIRTILWKIHIDSSGIIAVYCYIITRPNLCHFQVIRNGGHVNLHLIGVLTETINKIIPLRIVRAAFIRSYNMGIPGGSGDNHLNTVNTIFIILLNTIVVSIIPDIVTNLPRTWCLIAKIISRITTCVCCEMQQTSIRIIAIKGGISTCLYHGRLHRVWYGSIHHF